MRERDVLGHTIISMVTSSGVKGTLHAVHAAVMDSLPLPEVRHTVYHTKILILFRISYCWQRQSSIRVETFYQTPIFRHPYVVHLMEMMMKIAPS